MNLTLIKDFFTCHANLEDRINKNIKKFLASYPKLGIFSLFKQLTFGSVPELNAVHFQKYMTQFSSNLQIVEPNEINIYNRQKDVTNKKSLSQEQVLEKGINLFLKTWGNSSRQFSFAQFARFMKHEDKSPEKAVEVPYPAKKKLYEIFEAEIQGLLNIQTLRQICVKQYKNITDLFQNLASHQTHKIDKNSLNNLYLMHSQRMDSQFFSFIEKRMSLPMDFNRFLEIFKKDASQQNKKLKQRKIYFSSCKKRKDTYDYFEQHESDLSDSRNSMSYNTPKTHKVANGRHMTSTKLTKGEKVAQLKEASIRVNKFGTPQAQKFIGSRQIQILGQILSIQEAYIQLKRNLCLKKDFDLELVYQRQGHKFEHLLNQIYGSCNFSSFVRFMVPQDFEHRYLAFIRYQKSNTLSQQTTSMIEDLLEGYDRKQNQIQGLWQKIDREMMFRMYCNPCDKGIKGAQLQKYFTQRETKVLLERMDPLKTGQILFQNFK